MPAKYATHEQLEAAVDDLAASEEKAIEEWPKLPDAALYGVIGDLVELATRDSEADPAAVLMTSLATAGAIIGAGPYVLVGETKHPARAFTVLVGASSRARKGTSGHPVRRIFRAAEEQLKKEGALVDALVESHGPLSTGEGLIYAVRDPSEKADEDGKPVDEGVVDKRLLVSEGEFGAPLRAAQREGNTLSAILRMAWDSGDIAPMTKSNRIKATGAHVCVVGHITRMELGELLETSDIWNGLANRILWACVRRNKLTPFPRPMDDAEVAAIAARLASAIRRAWGVGMVLFDDTSVRIWQRLYRKLSADKPGVFGAVTARAEAHVIRLSLLFCLLDEEATVRRQHLKAALAVWQFCEASAMAIFGDATADPEANRVLEFLSTGEKTQTELRDLFGRNLSGDRLASILSELQAVGRIEQRKEKGRGRPVTMWFLNPNFQQ